MKHGQLQKTWRIKEQKLLVGEKNTFKKVFLLVNRTRYSLWFVFKNFLTLFLLKKSPQAQNFPSLCHFVYTVFPSPYVTKARQMKEIFLPQHAIQPDYLHIFYIKQF